MNVVWHDWRLVLVALLVGVYGVFSSLELGLLVLRLAKRGSLSTPKSQRWISLARELANVYLVFAVVSFGLLFAHGLTVVAKGVVGLLLLALLAGLVRSGLGLYMYRQNRLGVTKLNVGLLLSGLIMLLALGGIGVYLVTGQQFWQGSARILAVILLCGVLAGGLSWARLLDKRRSLPLRYPQLISSLLLGVTGGWWLPGVAATRMAHLSGYSYLAFSGLLNVTLLLVAILMLVRRDRWLAWWLLPVTIASPVLLALANRPYLVYPKLFLVTAQSSHSHTQNVIVGLVAILPLVALGLSLSVWLLIKLTKKVTGYLSSKTAATDSV